jgi:hypothetical protein
LRIFLHTADMNRLGKKIAKETVGISFNRKKVMEKEVLIQEAKNKGTWRSILSQFTFKSSTVENTIFIIKIKRLHGGPRSNVGTLLKSFIFLINFSN